MSAGSKIGRKQEAAIAALLTERTHADAAAKAGISEATLQRWFRDFGFIAAYRAARRQIVEGGIGRVQRVFGEAVDTLRRNLTCWKPSVEIRAAATARASGQRRRTGRSSRGGRGTETSVRGSGKAIMTVKALRNELRRLAVGLGMTRCSCGVILPRGLLQPRPVAIVEEILLPADLEALEQQATPDEASELQTILNRCLELHPNAEARDWLFRFADSFDTGPRCASAARRWTRGQASASSASMALHLLMAFSIPSGASRNWPHASWNWSRSYSSAPLARGSRNREPPSPAK